MVNFIKIEGWLILLFFYFYYNLVDIKLKMWYNTIVGGRSVW